MSTIADRVNKEIIRRAGPFGMPCSVCHHDTVELMDIARLRWECTHCGAEYAWTPE